MPKQTQTVYQLKVRLQGSEPPIWRRVLVAADITLAGLHEVLQIAMGWTDSHMHQFEANGQIFGAPMVDDGVFPVANEQSTRLDEVLRREKDSLRYEYDLGDNWEHQITVEKILPPDPQLQLPACVDAKGACPPEDIGGLWGYYEVLEVLRDPKHPDHEVLQDMFGSELDPDAFDIEEVNALLYTHRSNAA